MNGARRTKTISDQYTAALNTLYAHGYHGVHQLEMRHGAVEATAITPRGVQRQVTVEAGADKIQSG